MKNCLISLTIFAAVFLFTGCGDACDDIVCKNGGTAIANGSSCACSCEPGFEGEYCEMQTRQKIIGTFSAVVNCPHPDTVEKEFTIIPSGTFEDRVHISLNYYNTGCDTVSFSGTPYATVNRNTLTIPPQSYSIYGKDYILSGSGIITAGSSGIIIDLDVNPSPADSCFKSCSMVLTKI